MGLDLFVIPLWRYLSGGSRSTLETILRESYRRVGTPKPSEKDGIARERVAALQEYWTRRSGVPVSWSDEGEQAFTTQYDDRALHALRAFAASQDVPGKVPFCPGERPHEHPALVEVYRGAPTRFPHLIYHMDNAGFYVPCDFERPIPNDSQAPERTERPGPARRVWTRLRLRAAMIAPAVSVGVRRLRQRIGLGGIVNLMHALEPAATLDAYRRILATYPVVAEGDCTGSSPRLLRELDDLGRALGMEKDWGMLAEGQTAAAEGDPLGTVKYGWSVLHCAVRISVERALPLVFDG